jgi:hypothetical protein
MSPHFGDRLKEKMILPVDQRSIGANEKKSGHTIESAKNFFSVNIV